MSLGTQVAANLPYLRRYARALTGSQASGDAFVRATLEAALADDELKAALADPSGPRARLAQVFIDRILPEHLSLLVQARAGAAQLYALSADDLESA